MKHVSSRTGVLVALVVSSGLMLAQALPGPAGHWEGTIEIPGQPLDLAIDLVQSGESWDGTVAIPAQKMKGFPLSNIVVSGETVTFGMKIPGNPEFKGTLSKNGTLLSGDFTQGGNTLPFSLARKGEGTIALQPKSTAITKDLQGKWEGALDIGGKTLRLVVELSSQADGLGTGTLVSLDQGGTRIPIAAVVQAGARVTLAIPAIVGVYEGELQNGILTGTWTQGPGTLPLVLKRAPQP